MDNNPNPDPFDQTEQPLGQNSAGGSLVENPIDQDDNSARRVIIASISGVIVLGCCILFIAAFFFFQPNTQSLVSQYFPSPTATATQTPTPTPTPNLTATQQVINSTATAQAVQTSIANANSQWKVLSADKFNNNINQWDVGTSKDDYATIVREIKDGKYRWNASAKKGFFEWIRLNSISLSDFSLSVDGQRVSGSTSSDYGLIFRKDINGNLYYFAISDGGYFVALNYNNEWIDVIQWTESKAISSDEPNRLTVIGTGSHFIFLINNQYVADVTNDRIPKGTTGLGIELNDADLQANFEFDNLELRAP